MATGFASASQPPERETPVPFAVASAGCGVPPRIDGEVLASGEGWCWLTSDGQPIHLTGPDSPRGPLTVCLEDPPKCSLGERVQLDVPGERWAASPTPRPAPLERRERVLAALRASLRPDLAVPPTMPIVDVISEHGGRGPGLTPEGDDLLMGVIAARRAISGPEAASECAALARWAEGSAGEPSRSLLVHASRGELGEPAHHVLDALLVADAAEAQAALPDLLAWGATSGRALFTGLCCGVGA